ncbi:MAG TPA: LamG-like jellyroll fold domain-containing protein [Polyangiaceae bacterium]|nr:LamG-like jellyroll fold domain-containing protein [Polyangiaceae bacterium]
MLRGSSLIALFASALLVACGETHVTLLEPLVEHGGGSAPVDAATGGSSGNRGDLGDNGGDGGGAPGTSVAHLIHRYSFDGEGSRVVDSVGSADGNLMGGSVLDGAGHVTLDGSDDYVNLPNGLISGLSDVTLVAWLSWNGGRVCWQRVFDFGSSDAGEDHVGNATSSLFATPLRCPGTGPAAAFETKEGIVSSVDSDTPFPVLNVSLFAVVVDSKAGQLRLYAAGEPLGTAKPVSLSQLSGENDWLGRSQWVQDPYLRATYDEFRIYDVALGNAELAALEAAGPDAPR